MNNDKELELIVENMGQLPQNKLSEKQYTIVPTQSRFDANKYNIKWYYNGEEISVDTSKEMVEKVSSFLKTLGFTLKPWQFYGGSVYNHKV